jgi:DNA-binding NtrC family response regulator
VQKVGSHVTHDLDIRVIAATHRNLRSMVREGLFREDLYYRLAVVEMTLPTLAQRSQDLPLLQRHFLKKFALEYNKPISGFTRRAQKHMAFYPWPGNIRELENVIGNACMMVEGNVIDTEDLPQRVRGPLGDEMFLNENFLSLGELQKRHVLKVMEGVGGNKARAAKVLGIGRATLYQFLAKIKSNTDRREDTPA